MTENHILEIGKEYPRQLEDRSKEVNNEPEPPKLVQASRLIMEDGRELARLLYDVCELLYPNCENLLRNAPFPFFTKRHDFFSRHVSGVLSGSDEIFAYYVYEEPVGCIIVCKAIGEDDIIPASIKQVCIKAEYKELGILDGLIEKGLEWVHRARPFVLIDEFVLEEFNEIIQKHQWLDGGTFYNRYRAFNVSPDIMSLRS